MGLALKGLNKSLFAALQFLLRNEKVPGNSCLFNPFMLNHENGSAYFKNLPLCNTAKYCSYFVKTMIRKGIMNLEKELLRNVF